MTDEKYMRRALQLAANGRGGASPNPMVGAVITAPDGRVIGEGWHRVRGRGHAEVNAVASVADADRGLLKESTMYVTLEPCSHYGKTPPCAELILRTGIPHVVVATSDPNPKVAGRGIAMLRAGGVEVEVGMLGDEARALNRRFFTSQVLKRPWITLKWACSADGFMDHERTAAHPCACRFSNEKTGMSTMKLRGLHDAVLTTASTLGSDNCRLTVRGWYGRQPLRLVLDLHGRVSREHDIFNVIAPAAGSVAESGEEADLRGLCGAEILKDGSWDNLEELFHRLYADEGVSSVLVEAGPAMLGNMIRQGLWDAAREEVAEWLSLGSSGRCVAPSLPGYMMVSSELWGDNRINWYENRRNVYNGCEKKPKNI